MDSLAQGGDRMGISSKFCEHGGESYGSISPSISILRTLPDQVSYINVLAVFPSKSTYIKMKLTRSCMDCQESDFIFGYAADCCERE